MKRVAWFTDSTTANFTTSADNFVIPIEIVINGTAYKDCEEGVRERVYDALKQGITVTTSQPNFGDMVALFSKCKEEYEEGFAITISGKVSGTYQNMILAAEMAGFPLVVIDSETTSYPMDEILTKAQTLYRKGMTLQDIQKTIQHVERSPYYVFPKDLKGLYASGRVKGVQFILGSLLSVNLILEVKHGELVLEKKVRKIQKCKEYMRSELEKEMPNVVHVFHANDEEGAEEWIADFRAVFPEMKFLIYPLPISFAVHAGAGTIAISFLKGETRE
ncbi:alanine aminotransferase [Bacillus pseudomycoides]|uniref:DegV family protein n=1 Tax=Bacillus TaxID=1386 RepID=UPI0001A14868|nr:DegV family protein [Bacillus pseudomycoides]EEM11307.1 DegV [Bacillus pseudomycoides]MBD5800087.1 alanine aminotransferase [Bacillus pseudomycoides]MCR8859551.1 DegV family protein [Bacillus pseudomycoides]MED1477853.1 DegV family protein [Bacillus pseudomycoides]PEF22903.1 DegV family protein [Bacillus pseudomycoides]